MLADTIRAGCGGMMDRLTGGSVTARAHAIQRAGRFLAPGVVVSAYAVRQTVLLRIDKHPMRRFLLHRGRFHARHKPGASAFRSTD
jgi:hypothetical protein